ncbi:hypothetical protein K505DRAFT_376414 [Melanomma pulvis-pyrius CBS 109.77]|uniref:WLM domain-containing protein n=1 Tax=Melanomma pulvis-pyrius CBS 109.77 TaxID=1314802 RepID=A0A6A6X6G5_9PLEO|nr:hypothetical protein K505DRAFT_376414 [Melanomma pulvis-pyrius CBS 109.77]
MEEVEAILAYAENRASPRAPFKREGTLLQDLLNASKEDDNFKTCLTNELHTGWFAQARLEIAKLTIVIHCDDKHLTKTDGRKDLYFDNSNGRQARVQVLNHATRKPTACGGVMRAFAYEFKDKATGKRAGDAIVLCSDAGGALTAADKDTDLKFWRDKDLRSMEQGLDFFNRFLSYMLLHELMHVTDHSQCKHELYGYKEITGNAVGQTGASGPASLVRLHNADSYAFLACAWYMHGYHFQAGKFVLTPKKDRPPPSLPELIKRIQGRGETELEARAPKGSKTKKPGKPKTPKKSKKPKEPTNSKTTTAPKASNKPKKLTKKKSKPKPACDVPTKPKKGIRGLLERAATKVTGKGKKPSHRLRLRRAQERQEKRETGHEQARNLPIHDVETAAPRDGHRRPRLGIPQNQLLQVPCQAHSGLGHQGAGAERGAEEGWRRGGGGVEAKATTTAGLSSTVTPRPTSGFVTSVASTT